MSWPTIKIGDCTHLVTKGTTPTKTQGFSSSGVNFIKAEALNGDSSLDMSGQFYISESVHDQLKRSNLELDDVLVTIAGVNIGKCGIVKSAHLPANTNQAVGIIRVDKSKIYPLFLYYWFKQNNTFRYIQSLNAQAAQPNINLAMLRNLAIPKPQLTEQKQISSVLSAYDDLIETNRRRMRLLEESARLLYKEWFVHLRFPGHERCKIVDGVPEGWEVKNLQDIATLFYGKALKEDSRIPGQYPVYGSSGIVGTHNAFLVDAPCIIIGRKGNVGSIYYSQNNCFPIDTVYYIKRDNTSFFLYFALKNLNFISTDVAVPGLNRKYAYSLKLLLPENKIMGTFEDYCTPIFNQLATLKRENNQLAEARDLLLPRLMSGEVAV